MPNHRSYDIYINIVTLRADMEKLPKTRETALVLTKIDEAGMWLTAYMAINGIACPSPEDILQSS
jgi:hypothetical protein